MNNNKNKLNSSKNKLNSKKKLTLNYNPKCNLNLQKIWSFLMPGSCSRWVRQRPKVLNFIQLGYLFYSKKKKKKNQNQNGLPIQKINFLSPFYFVSKMGKGLPIKKKKKKKKGKD